MDEYIGWFDRDCRTIDGSMFWWGGDGFGDAYGNGAGDGSGNPWPADGEGGGRGDGPYSSEESLSTYKAP